MTAEPFAQQIDRPTKVSFFVAGLPCPQGNKTPIPGPGGRGIRLVEGRRPKARKQFAQWRTDVRNAAVARGVPPIRRGVAVTIRLRFFMPAPKVLPKGRWAPSVRPDLDKLERAIGDALTGVIYEDDSQIVDSVASKRYATDAQPAGVDITVSTWIGPIA